MHGCKHLTKIIFFLNRPLFQREQNEKTWTLLSINVVYIIYLLCIDGIRYIGSEICVKKIVTAHIKNCKVFTNNDQNNIVSYVESVTCHIFCFFYPKDTSRMAWCILCKIDDHSQCFRTLPTKTKNKINGLLYVHPIDAITRKGIFSISFVK